MTYSGVLHPEGLDKSLVGRHGITMARFPDWCEKYTSLRRVPNKEIEAKLHIVQPISPELQKTEAYAKLLRYLIKRDGALIRMYTTDGERSINYHNQLQYHAVIVLDNTRIRMFYQNDRQRGYVRGWMLHYYYESTYDVWSREDVQSNA